MFRRLIVAKNENMIWVDGTLPGTAILVMQTTLKRDLLGLEMLNAEVENKYRLKMLLRLQELALSLACIVKDNAAALMKRVKSPCARRPQHAA